MAKMVIWRRQKGFLEAGSNGKRQCTPAIQNRGGGLVGGRSPPDLQTIVEDVNM